MSRPKPPPPPPPIEPIVKETADVAETMASSGEASERREMGAAYRSRAARRGARALRIRLTSNVSGGSGSNVGY